MPVDSVEISKALNGLKQLHQKEDENLLYYQKLAIIELCGWIEFCMDEIVKNYFYKKVTNQRCNTLFESMIEKNHGFRYEDNFCILLYKTIGLHNFKIIEDAILPDIETFKVTLSNLTKLRNDVAHTHIARGTLTQSPTLTITQFNIVAPILEAVYNEVDKL